MCWIQFLVMHFMVWNQGHKNHPSTKFESHLNHFLTERFFAQIKNTVMFTVHQLSTRSPLNQMKHLLAVHLDDSADPSPGALVNVFERVWFLSCRTLASLCWIFLCCEQVQFALPCDKTLIFNVKSLRTSMGSCVYHVVYHLRRIEVDPVLFYSILFYFVCFISRGAFVGGSGWMV